MAERKNQESPENQFTRRSKTESICMFCFITVRSEIPAYLELAEDVHSQTCPRLRLLSTEN
jgi:hypothetical protein